MPSSPSAAAETPHVLVLPKWWPNARDPQLGDFIRKQVQATARFTRITIMLIKGDPEHPPGVARADADDLIVIRSRYRTSQSPVKPLRKLVNLLRYWKAAMAGWRMVLQERGKPDLVHVHILVRPALVAHWIKRKYGIPYILSEQSSEYLDGTYRRKGPLFHALNRRLFSDADAVTAVSGWLGDGLKDLGLCTEYGIVPNVIPGLDRPLPSRGPAGHFMVVADLVDRTKNVSGVIRALAMAARGHDKLRLTVIGDGPDRGYLEELATTEGVAQRVKFLGRLPNAQVLDHMAHASAVIINSNVETFSVVTGEALAQGKPVIATRCGGPQGFVTDTNGFLIDVGDTKALAAAMVHLADKSAMYDPTMIRASVNERFSPEAVGRAFKRIHQRSLPPPASA
ncbi:MAG: glycosyltransferase [Flavobacteriales bacterium]|nr:glycosyltransferase [Flavobacteriales bacterium]